MPFALPLTIGTIEALKTKRMNKIKCKDTEEVCTTYQKYLNSIHWKNLKKRFKNSKIFKHKCYCCLKTNRPISIHHKSYKRLGDEPLNHLIALCQECHELVHKTFKGKTSQKVNLWNISKKIRKKMANHSSRFL